MTLHLIKATRLGLEVWEVRRDGRKLAVFMSEAMARTRFEQLKQKMGK